MPRTFEVSSRDALLLIGGWTAALLVVALFFHPTPLYFVETDLLGEYLPAAREWLSGHVQLSHYSYKGPGYPLLVALFAWPLGGDVLLASKILSPLAAGLAAWLAFAIARDRTSPPVAAYVLLAFLCAPVASRYAIEAGTDMPALALMLAATALAFREGVASAAMAGLLTGCAIATRTNAAFLVPCSIVVLATGPLRWRRLAAFVVATIAPLALWAGYARAHGGLPADRNYLNVAWELYGQGQPWERFEASAGQRFHSLLEVLRFDPARAAWRMAQNFVVHRADDWRELTTPWLGTLAPLGFVLLARDARSRAWLLYGAACALALALVFYNARFGLYLLPIELAGQGAALAWAHARLGAAGRAWIPAATALVLAIALVAGVRGNAERLADAPHETRIVGEELARRGLAGAAIYARKPHVGWFSGLRTVGLPLDVPLASLPKQARADGVDYLFYSGIERVQRPEWAVLGEERTALPGIEPILYAQLARKHFFAVYRLDAARFDSLAFDSAYARALDRLEAAHPNDPEQVLFVAVQRYQRGDASGALARLDALERAGVHDPSVSRLRGIALDRLGRLDEAAAAFRDWIRLGEPSAEKWNRLGRVYGRQSKYAEAIDAFERGLTYEPTSLELLSLLGQTQMFAHRPADAARTFERAVALAPGDVSYRRFVIGAWQSAGDGARTADAYRQARAAGFSDVQLAGAPPPASGSPR